MNEQIDKAIANEDFAFAFDVLNSIPTPFDEDSRFYYDHKSGKIGEYDEYAGRDQKYTYEQYNRKAVSVLKAESYVLLSKDDIEAENLFLEHLADFDLGVNTVNLDDNWGSGHLNERYMTAVSIYNDYLVSVVRKAMVKNKPALSKKISLLIRDGLSRDTKNDTVVWYYDTEAKDEAQNIINSYNVN